MTTATMTLTEFLLARIAEDEAAAKAANDFPYSIRSTPWGKTFDIVADSPDSRADHWFCVDPARVLAECEAKRRIVSLHPEMLEWCQGCAHEPHPCRTIRALATVYSDHPDYREDWRP